LIKSHLGLIERLPAGRVLAYGLFPPLLVVGPIASYDETAATLDHRVPLDPSRLVSGAGQVLTGLVKVFLVAFLLDWSSDVFAVFEVNSTWRIWVALIAFGWFFYVNFAGYSDIAIGSGRVLGADLRPNFDRPYQQTNPTAFWNSWHISLTRFLRANVYTPLAAGRPRRQPLATMVTMLLIALWHGVTWATVVFGVYHGTSLIVHRQFERRRPPSSALAVRVAKMVAIFLWFTLSLPLLQLDLDSSIDFYARLVPG
jgi:alginate O-acetyltransferase complex protein AlgI